MRSFSLKLPPSKSETHPKALQIEAPDRLSVPALLHRRGLSGYEPETVSTFLAALDYLRPQLVYDIGANVGIFALLAGALSDADVVAFEPEPSLADTAERLLSIDAISSVLVERVALSDRVGEAHFYLSSNGDSSNSLAEGLRVPTDTIRVRTQTLDSYTADRAPTLMKMDVEAAEPLVLSGGESVI